MYREWLEKKRITLGLTHQAVATDCNITRAYYTQIEMGTRRPSVTVAKKIAKRLNFDWTIFFKDECNVMKQKCQKKQQPCCPNPAKPAHALPELDCPESVCCALCPDPCNSRQPCRREQAATTEPGPKPAA